MVVHLPRLPPSPPTEARSIELRFRWKCCSTPRLCAWYADTWLCFTANCCRICSNIWEVKLDLWSLCITCRMPKVEINALTTDLTEIDRNRNTAGHLVTWHIPVSRYALHWSIPKRLSYGWDGTERCRLIHLTWFTSELTGTAWCNISWGITR